MATQVNDLSIEQLSTDEIQEPGNAEQTSSAVLERFKDAKSWADGSLNAAESALANLARYFGGGDIPSVTVDYFKSELNASISTPTPPTAPESNITDVTVPTKPNVSGVTPNDIAFTGTPPTEITDPSFDFSEVDFSGAVTASIESHLVSMISAAASGLSESVESAIYSRALDRTQDKKEEAYVEVETYFSARGYVMPPGAMVGRLQEVVQEHTRLDEQINYETMINQAKIAQEDYQFFMGQAIEYDKVGRTFHNAMMDRALKDAIASVEVIVSAYETKVKAYAHHAAAYSSRVEGEKMRIEAISLADKLNVDVYEAEVRAYAAQVQAELGIVEASARIYTAQVAGFEAEVSAAIKELTALIAQQQMNNEQARSNTAISLKEAEIILNAYIQRSGLDMEAEKGVATVAAQLAASALNAVHASASLGVSTTRNRSDGVSASYNISNSALLSETHSYDETTTGA